MTTEFERKYGDQVLEAAPHEVLEVLQNLGEQLDELMERILNIEKILIKQKLATRGK